MIATDLEAVARQFERWDLQRNATLILAHLLLRGEALTSVELCESLQMSRSAVSTQTRILLRMGVLQRTRRPGERARCFRVDSGFLERRLTGRVRQLEDTLHALEGPGSNPQLLRVREFYTFWVRGLRELEAEWAARSR